MHTDLCRVASSFLGNGLFLQSNTNLSLNFCRSVLNVLVFALHPDSLMMRSACLKSGPIFLGEGGGGEEWHLDGEAGRWHWISHVTG